MKQGYVSLRARALNRLMEAGSWLGREQLQALTTCQSALDDVLADLVVDQQVEFRPHGGYRLVGTPAARRAAQLMRRSDRKAAAVVLRGREFVHVGVAEHRAVVGLVWYELAIPHPDPDLNALERQLEQLGGVIAFVNDKGGLDVRSQG